MGAYAVDALSSPRSGIIDNSLVGAGLASAGIPTFAPHQAEYTVSKCEFLQSIYAPISSPPTAPGGFQNQVLTINPGLQQTFPWLGLVAPQFEEYELKQLMFYWRPMVTDFNSGTGQAGEIIMVTQYNPSDAPFTDTLRAKSYDGAMSSKTSIPMNHGVECDPKLNSGAPGKYVRIGPLDGQNQDLKQYDWGNLNVIVNGTPPGYSGQLLGELWCAYTVTLRKPKLPITTGATILRDYFESATPPLQGEQEADLTLPLNATTWVNQLYVSAQQNRIQGSLVPLYSAPGTIIGTTGPSFSWRYKVPAWYTGTVRFTVSLIGAKVWPLSPADTTVQFFVAGSSGELVTDLVQATTLLANGITLAPSLAQDASGTAQAPGVITKAYQNYERLITGQLTVTVDVNFENQASGTENYIDIGTREIFEINGWTFDVTEYNDSFNNSDTGKITLVDEAGQVVPSVLAN